MSAQICIGNIVYVLMVWFMCWWCSQGEQINILGVLFCCYVISPRQVSLILELGRQPGKLSVSCLFPPYGAGCTDTVIPRFLLIGNNTRVLVSAQQVLLPTQQPSQA